MLQSKNLERQRYIADVEEVMRAATEGRPPVKRRSSRPSTSPAPPASSTNGSLEPTSTRRLSNASIDGEPLAKKVKKEDSVEPETDAKEHAERRAAEEERTVADQAELEHVLLSSRRNLEQHAASSSLTYDKQMRAADKEPTLGERRDDGSWEIIGIVRVTHECISSRADCSCLAPGASFTGCAGSPRESCP